MERKTLSALMGIVIVVLTGAAACVYVKYESDLGSEQFAKYSKNPNKTGVINIANQNNSNVVNCTLGSL